MINKAILLGRVGADPEVRAVGTKGDKVARVRIATSEKFKNKDGERKEQTEWHTVQFWSPLAEIVDKYVGKGSLIYIEGRIQYREFTGKDGNKRYTTEILGSLLKMIDSKKEESSSNGASTSNSGSQYERLNTAAKNTDIYDDLPF